MDNGTEEKKNGGSRPNSSYDDYIIFPANTTGKGINQSSTPNYRLNNRNSFCKNQCNHPKLIMKNIFEKKK